MIQNPGFGALFIFQTKMVSTVTNPRIRRSRASTQIPYGTIAKPNTQRVTDTIVYRYQTFKCFLFLLIWKTIIVLNSIGVMCISTGNQLAADVYLDGERLPLDWHVSGSFYDAYRNT